MWKLPETSGCLDNHLLERLGIQLNEVLSGDKEVVFSGGEPLLYDGITKIIKIYSREGLRVGMASNGVLIDSKKAKDLADAGLKNIQISFDSLYPDTHDFLRGVAGSHERVLKAAQYLNVYRDTLTVCAQTVISGRNIDEIIDTVQFVKDSKCFSHISFMAVTAPFFALLENNWQEHKEFTFLWPQDPEKTDSVINRLIEMKDEGYPIANPVSHLELFREYFHNPGVRKSGSSCHLGDNVVSVDPLGDLRLCCSTGPLGNINRSRLLDILRGSEVEDLRAKMRSCDKTCNALVNCFFKEQ